MRKKLWRGLNWKTGLFLPVFLVTIAVPIANYFAGLILHPSAWQADLFAANSAARLGQLLFQTAGLAGLAASLAILFGGAVFISAYAITPRFRSPYLGIAALAFFIPGHLAALAWIQTIGNTGWVTLAVQRLGISKSLPPGILYSLPGCATLMALHFYPIALGLLLIGINSIGEGPAAAGQIFMNSPSFWRAILWGWLRPWFASAWLILFIMSLLEYLVPFLLRRPVFAVEIMSAFSVHYEKNRAAALAFPLIAVSCGAALLLWRIHPEIPALNFGSFRAALPPPPRSWRIISIIFSVAVISLSLIVPVASLAKIAGGFENYRKIFISARDQIATSLIWSMVAALIIAAEGLALAALRRRWISVVLLALLALPGSVIGIAEIEFWNRASWGDLMGKFYDSGGMLLLGFTAVILPPVYLILRRKIEERPRVLDDLEKLAGNSSIWRWWSLTAAPVREAIVAAALLAFVLAMCEAHASILLVTPGQETLAIRTYTLLHFAPDSLVAGLCLISLGVMIAGSSIILLAARLIPDPQKKGGLR